MRRRRVVAGAALAAAAAAAPSLRAAQFEPGRGLVALPQQEFTPPPAGSYRLPVIQPAADGWVLEGNRMPRRLVRYTHGALTLLAFVYTYCTDPVGCPLAYESMLALRRRVQADASLRGRVRFVSLSLDPTHDTPEAMQAYGGEFARAAEPRWHFLTTGSVRLLKPILDGYGQDVEVELDDDGHPTRTLTHMLKLFLIDAAGQVREIYSAAFLQPEVMHNDLRTLALETSAAADAARR